MPDALLMIVRLHYVASRHASHSSAAAYCILHPITLIYVILLKRLAGLLMRVELSPSSGPPQQTPTTITVHLPRYCDDTSVPTRSPLSAKHAQSLKLIISIDAGIPHQRVSRPDGEISRYGLVDAEC